MIEAGFKYFSQSKLYIWKKNLGQHKTTQGNLVQQEKEATAEKMGAKLDGSKLRDLAWSLDVLDLSKKSSTITNK